MKCSFEEYPLFFKRPFGVSQNMRSSTDCLIVTLEFENIRGHGEATLPPYLDENLPQTISFIEKFKKLHFKSLPSIEEFNAILQSIEENCFSAKAALDIAFHDLIGKIQQKSISDIYQIQSQLKQSSYTIGLDSPETMIEKIHEAYGLGFNFLKIKMGTNNDIQLFQTISKYIQTGFSIDANQGWKDTYMAFELCAMFSECGASYLEQPFDKNNLIETEWLSSRSPLPIIADESCKSLVDFEKIQGCFHGINIKLMKCGGIWRAMELFKLAQKNKLKTVAGCMAESSCGISAMSHLSSLADWVDLDAPFLIANDPFEKLNFQDGTVVPSQNPGIGVQKLSESNI